MLFQEGQADRALMPGRLTLGAGYALCALNADTGYLLFGIISGTMVAWR